MSLNLSQSPQAGGGPICRNVNSPAAFVDIFPDGISVARFVSLRVTAGVLTVRMTTTAGVDQVFDLSDLHVLSNPIAGYGVTALAVQGSADLEYLITGDA